MTAGPIARGAYRELLEEHGAEQLDERAQGAEPSEPVDEPTTGPARFGTRALDASGRAALQHTAEVQPAVRPWASSPQQAVRRWVSTRDHGASLRSTSDPDRANRVQTSKSPGDGGREHDAIERARNVSRAMDRAEADVAEIAIACPVLTPGEARAVVLLKVTGMLTLDYVAIGGVKRKGRFERRDPLTAPQVVALVREHLGRELTERHVHDLCSHFLAVVRRDLEASGEMRPRVQRDGARRGFATDPAARIRRG